MNVQITEAVNVGGIAFAAGEILEIPRELYNPSHMTRLGTALAPAQQAALVRWKDRGGIWTHAIAVE